MIKRPSILAVERNMIEHDLLQAYFMILGYDGDVVERAEEALDLLSVGETYDAIFTGVRLRGMGGVEFALKVRELGISIPVIAITASAMAGDREKLLNTGLSDYISKPYTRNELALAVERVTATASEPTRTPRGPRAFDGKHARKLA